MILLAALYIVLWAVPCVTYGHCRHERGWPRTISALAGAAALWVGWQALILIVPYP